MAVYLGVSITQNSQSVANNTSNVTVRVYCSWTGGSYNAQTAPDGLPQARGWLNVDGARYNFYSYFNTGRTSSGSQTLFTKTLDIEHNAEGIKTLACSASYATGVSSGTLSASNSLKLTDIPRYARLDKAEAFTDESNPTIQYVNPAGAIASSVRAGIALMDNTVVVAYRNLDVAGTSYTFSLTESERNALRFATPTSNELKVQFLIETVIGGVTGVNSLASTMHIVNANPAVSPVIRDTNSVTLNVTQDASVLVALRSIAQVNINAVAQKGATIQIQQVVQGNKVLDGDGSFLVANSSSIYVEVVDSRGNKTTVQATNSIVPYIEPTCLIEQVRPDGTGEIPLTIIGKVYNGAIGRTTNNVVVQYRNKVGYGQYSAWHTIGSVELSDNNFTAFVEITGLDYKARHTLQARVIDILNADGVLSAEAVFVAIPVFEWGPEDFQFNVPLNMASRQYINFLDSDTGLSWQYPGEYYVMRPLPGVGLELLANNGNGFYAPIRILPDGYLNLGDAQTGNIDVGSTRKLSLWEDGEGGNIEIDSPNGHSWHVDAFDNNLRIYHAKYSEGIVHDHYLKLTIDGKLLVDGNPVTTKTLLWHNAAPHENSFYAQTLSLNLSNYDFIEIVFTVDPNAIWEKNIAKFAKNSYGHMQVMGHTRSAGTALFSIQRAVYPTNTGIQFEGAYYKFVNDMSSIENSAYLVPVDIYGIREVY